MPAPRRRHRSPALALVAAGLTGLIGTGLGLLGLSVLLGALAPRPGCGGTVPGGGIGFGPPGGGAVAGATEYGGPGDPSSGTTGARSDNLLQHPDSYAELGGLTWDTATRLGGLPYMTPLRISWGQRSVIAYKRDFGLGGPPIDGHPRMIDLWWQLAARLGIPYERGQWSGTVRLARPPDTGAGPLLGDAIAPGQAPAAIGAPERRPDCPVLGGLTVAEVPGVRARLLPDGLAAAPAGAPAAVAQMIAAGNQIVGRPYLMGGGHGLPLSELAPAYDCSSSVDHLLYGARLLPVTATVPSGTLMSFGAVGPGRWVTIYASPDHVFMYVAGLRWDTHDAAGPGDGGHGIGWHPLVRSAAGFTARHPVGL